MKKTSELFTNKIFPTYTIAHKVNQLSLINQHLQAILPQELQTHCVVANLNEHCLILLTDNAHWLTPLRFMSPDLLKRMQSRFSAIKTLKFIISTHHAPETKDKTPLVLSTEAATTILEYAKNIEDPGLQLALQKLASRATCTS